MFAYLLNIQFEWKIKGYQQGEMTCTASQWSLRTIFQLKCLLIKPTITYSVSTSHATRFSHAAYWILTKNVCCREVYFIPSLVALHKRCARINWISKFNINKNANSRFHFVANKLKRFSSLRYTVSKVNYWYLVSKEKQV